MIFKGRVSKENILFIITLLFALILNLIFLPQYILGDQLHYRAFYDSITSFGISEGFLFYQNSLGSSEPGYFLIAWSLSNLGFQKDVVIIFFNILLAGLSFKIFTRLGAHPLIATIITTFSYYSYVLFFAAERLKFSIIFFLMFFLFKRYRNILLSFAILCHAQVLILLSSFGLVFIKNIFFNFFKKGILKKRDLYAVILFFIILAVSIPILGQHLLSKFESYYSDRGLSDLLRVFIFFILSFFYSKNKFNVFLLFMPIFILVFIFGGERINFLGYFLFLYCSLHYRKGFNFGVLATTLYFIYTGYNFLLNITNYGDGFYGI
jgi:hypothetical protein